MIGNMELYRVFYMVAQAGSFSKAAEQLYITQPAVSHAMKQLEEHLGGPLFVRSSRGIKLTAEGEVLLQFVAQAHHFLLNGEKKVAEMRQLMVGEVKIGASDTLCRYFLLPYLESYYKQYPSIHIQVTNRTTQETIHLLKEGRIDFGVINLPIDDKSIVVRESMPMNDCFVIAANNPLLAALTLPLSWEQLAKLPLLLLEEGSSIRRSIDHFAERQGITIDPEIELGSIDLLVQFARIGLGIACVIRQFIERELNDGTLVELPLEVPLPARQIGLVTLPGVPLSAAAQRFLDRLPSSSHGEPSPSNRAQLPGPPAQ